MRLRNKKILLTGATGGIGQLICQALLEQGARVILTSRQTPDLSEFSDQQRDNMDVAVLDFLSAQLEQQIDTIIQQHFDIDIVFHCAGMNSFSACDEISVTDSQRLLAVNLSGPILLTQKLLPNLRQRDEAAVVVVGSTFGSIGYPGFSVYCATKFGLRGYTESLRRELANSRVKVFYMAPRATLTSMNEPEVVALNKRLGNAMDNPEKVAQTIIRAILNDKKSLFIGWPEKFFVFLNAALSSVVDKALIKQLPIINEFLKRGV